MPFERHSMMRARQGARPSTNVVGAPLPSSAVCSQHGAGGAATHPAQSSNFTSTLPSIRARARCVRANAATAIAPASAATSSPRSARRAAGPRPGTASVHVSIQRELPFGSSMRIVGEDASLGGWVLEDSVLLEWTEGHVWVTTLHLPPGEHAFKFVIDSGPGHSTWEPGPNRMLAVPAAVVELGIRTHWGDVGATQLQGEDRLDPGQVRALRGQVDDAESAARAAEREAQELRERANTLALRGKLVEEVVGEMAALAKRVDGVRSTVDEWKAAALASKAQVQELRETMGSQAQSGMRGGSSDSVRDLSARLDGVAGEVKLLWSDLEATRSAQGGADEGELGRLRVQVESVRAMALACQQDVEEVVDRVQTMQGGGVSELASKVAALATRLDEVSSKTASLHTDVDETRQTVAFEEVNIKALRTQVEEWRNVAKTCQQDMAELADRVNSLGGSAPASAAGGGAGVAGDQAVAEVRALNKRLESVMASVEALVDTQKNAAGEAAAVKALQLQQAEEWRAAQQASAQQLSQLRERIGGVEAKSTVVEAAAGQVGALTVRVESVANAVQAVHAEVAKLWGSRENQPASAEEVAALRQQAEQWRAEAQASQNEVAQLKERISALEGSLTGVSESMNNLAASVRAFADDEAAAASDEDGGEGRRRTVRRRRSSSGWRARANLSEELAAVHN